MSLYFFLKDVNTKLTRSTSLQVYKNFKDTKPADVIKITNGLNQLEVHAKTLMNIHHYTDETFYLLDHLFNGTERERTNGIEFLLWDAYNVNHFKKVEIVARDYTGTIKESHILGDTLKNYPKNAYPRYYKPRIDCNDEPSYEITE